MLSLAGGAICRGGTGIIPAGAAEGAEGVAVALSAADGTC